MRLRPLLFVAIIAYCALIFCAVLFSPKVHGQEIVVGIIADEPVNLVTTEVGELTVTTGTVGDEPVNTVDGTDGRLIARIHWDVEIVELTEAPEPEPDDG